MGGKPQYDWLPDSELVDFTAKYPTNVAAASAMGVPIGTFKSHIVMRGLTARIFQARKRKPVSSQSQESDVSAEDLLRAELSDLKQRVNRDRKADVAEERLIQSVEAALTSVRRDAPSIEMPSELPSDDAHHRQVLILSDFHGGEVVDPNAVNGLNAYSWQIQQERVDEVIASALSHKRSAPELTGLDVLFVGDMCSGSNHEELAITNEYPLAEQGVRVGYLQARILECLASHYANIRSLVIVGNHPRLPKKPAAKNVHDNMDWVAGLVCKESLRNVEHVSIDVPKSAAAWWEVAGRTMYVWHGDGVRSSMPGVPWGGVMRRVNALTSQHRRRIDHFVLGHYHQANVVQGGRIIMNGALKGVDEWSLKSFGGGDPPTQLLLTFDEKAERLTNVAYITPRAGVPQ